MDDGKMFGQRTTLQNKKRCEYCNKAVSFGYIVNDPNFRGFFCSAPHARLAYQNMMDIAEKENIQVEGQDE